MGGSGPSTDEAASVGAYDLSPGKLFTLEGRVCLVTGGGTGLGLMMTQAFAQAGARRVYISSRKLSNLKSAADALNKLVGKEVVVPITSDLTSKKGCDDLAAEIAKREKRLDVLVNNSGLSWGAEIEDTDESKGWDRVMHVNVKSLFYLTVALLPLLKVGKSAWEVASVINISSIYSQLSNPYMPTAPAGKAAVSYLASKAAASHLTRTMAVPLMKEHVTCNAILPGFVDTKMTAHASGPVISKSHPSGRASGPSEIAGAALLFASGGKGGAGAHLTGTSVTVDGGMSLWRVPEEIQGFYSVRGGDSKRLANL